MPVAFVGVPEIFHHIGDIPLHFLYGSFRRPIYETKKLSDEERLCVEETLLEVRASNLIRFHNYSQQSAESWLRRAKYRLSEERRMRTAKATETPQPDMEQKCDTSRPSVGDAAAPHSNSEKVLAGTHANKPNTKPHPGCSMDLRVSLPLAFPSPIPTRWQRLYFNIGMLTLRH